MTAGITVYNDWGTVQVDENWATLSLRHKLSVAVQTLTVNNSIHGYDGSVTFPATSPVYFWKATVPVTFRGATQNGDGTTTLTLRSTDPAAVTLYVFDTPEWSTQSYGLEVFNASGVKVFGDQLRPLKIVAVAPVSAVPFVWDGLPGGSYAVCLSGLGVKAESFHHAVLGDVSNVWTAGTCERSQGGSIDWVTGAGNVPFVLPQVSIPPQFLIIADVSGL